MQQDSDMVIVVSVVHQQTSSVQVFNHREYGIGVQSTLSVLRSGDMD